jgi:hypothetical protein
MGLDGKPKLPKCLNIEMEGNFLFDLLLIGRMADCLVSFWLIVWLVRQLACGLTGQFFKSY